MDKQHQPGRSSSGNTGRDPAPRIGSVVAPIAVAVAVAVFGAGYTMPTSVQGTISGIVKPAPEFQWFARDALAAAPAARSEADRGEADDSDAMLAAILARPLPKPIAAVGGDLFEQQRIAQQPARPAAVAKSPAAEADVKPVAAADVKRLAAGLVVDPAAGEAAPAVVVARPSPPLTAEQHNIVRFIARHYRVALDTTQEVVHYAYRTARDLKMDPHLILAIMSVESSFNPRAQSSAGAQGLMQVHTRVHSEKFQPFGGVAAAFDPVANIRVGSKILKEYLVREGSVEGALKAYVGAAMLPSDGGYGTKVLGEREKIAAVAAGDSPVASASDRVATDPNGYSDSMPTEGRARGASRDI